MGLWIDTPLSDIFIHFYPSLSKEEPSEGIRYLRRHPARVQAQGRRRLFPEPYGWSSFQSSQARCF